MPRIQLPGFGQGHYAIAGIVFTDGVAYVDDLSAKQRRVLGDLGAEVDGTVPEGTPQPEDQPEGDQPQAGDPDSSPVAPEQQDVATPTPAPEDQPPATPQGDPDAGPATDAPQPEQPTTIASSPDGSEATDTTPGPGTTQQ